MVSTTCRICRMGSSKSVSNDDGLPTVDILDISRYLDTLIHHNAQQTGRNMSDPHYMLPRLGCFVKGWPSSIAQVCVEGPRLRDRGITRRVSESSKRRIYESYYEIITRYKITNRSSGVEGSGIDVCILIRRVCRSRTLIRRVRRISIRQSTSIDPSI